jgi:hypothetical protein
MAFFTQSLTICYLLNRQIREIKKISPNEQNLVYINTETISEIMHSESDSSEF